MFCDYAPAAFYDEKRVVARKRHRCCETGRVIEPGEAYWRCVGKWEGEVMAYAQSEFAYRFARKLNGVEPYDAALRNNACVPFGGVGEHVAELRHDLPPEWVAEWDAEMDAVLALANAAPASPARATGGNEL